MNVAIRQVEDLGMEFVVEDGLFRCAHINAEVEPPCCSGIDSEGLPSCGCYGQYSVYCYDCHNKDMTDADVENIVEAYLEPPEYDHDDC